MVNAVKDLVPMLLPFVPFTYSTSSPFWGDEFLETAEGIQQRDPLGFLLFCLAIHQLTIQLNWEFHIFYLDDRTLGGNVR